MQVITAGGAVEITFRKALEHECHTLLMKLSLIFQAFLLHRQGQMDYDSHLFIDNKLL